MTLSGSVCRKEPVKDQWLSGVTVTGCNEPIQPRCRYSMTISVPLTRTRKPEKSERYQTHEHRILYRGHCYFCVDATGAYPMVGHSGHDLYSSVKPWRYPNHSYLKISVSSMLWERNCHCLYRCFLCGVCEPTRTPRN